MRFFIIMLSATGDDISSNLKKSFSYVMFIVYYGRACDACRLKVKSGYNLEFDEVEESPEPLFPID